jgi:predicted CoA-binding protein
MSLQTAAEEFLSQKRIAVVGVSRDKKATGHAIFKTLRARGHDVVPVNPHAEEVAGGPCYPSVGAIPDAVDAVVVVTPSDVAADVVRDCAEAGVTRVWLHHNALFGAAHGSASEEAVEVARERGLEVIAGACPLMFGEQADLGHKCMRWLLGAFHKLPEAA